MFCLILNIVCFAKRISVVLRLCFCRGRWGPIFSRLKLGRFELCTLLKSPPRFKELQHVVLLPVHGVGLLELRFWLKFEKRSPLVQVAFSLLDVELTLFMASWNLGCKTTFASQDFPNYYYCSSPFYICILFCWYNWYKIENTPWHIFHIFPSEDIDHVNFSIYTYYRDLYYGNYNCKTMNDIYLQYIFYTTYCINYNRKPINLSLNNSAPGNGQHSGVQSCSIWQPFWVMVVRVVITDLKITVYYHEEPKLSKAFWYFGKAKTKTRPKIE